MRKGFTLIELLIFVIIIGTIAAIAIPKFSKAGRRNVDGQYTPITSEPAVESRWGAPRRFEDMLPSGTMVTCYEARQDYSLSCVIDPRQFNQP